ncbi:hypothetical protein AQ505_12985 [Pedobacter sp. PACM 27299]|uniref:hypothetical protein n=1 Tax=Pedobacter sp. PACM 27299 TaxID=1727164 RepID=UPI0007060B9B|nr:hypothetical protein [Pedobacter sp. PACM 27299]ALL06333.1 hypothetical protein AQ505_12985 [Pedobacter sp. PACM 27299]
MERLEKLKELKSEFKKLKEDSMVTRFKGFNQTLTVDEDFSLNEAIKQLSNLSIKIENLSGKYAVEYIGELYDWKTNTFYASQPATDCLILDTICIIDTQNEVGTDISGDKLILRKEIEDYLCLTKYSNFKILSIKNI